ncbi:uncharacterized protein LOC116609570 [Nematostella vectensis]|uniref:uncharacterized protein LOC116609569 n=1 Tax=Nematostella vectensis TaxID=45351 RepID=UPI002076FB66|nr:uncharacterized protein LOC116609569 [Nematostella vectensis]XP_032226253.2 uncharacterized protein LOC116609570 [Nematostella vectensis]
MSGLFLMRLKQCFALGTCVFLFIFGILFDRHLRLRPSQGMSLDSNKLQVPAIRTKKVIARTLKEGSSRNKTTLELLHNKRLSEYVKDEKIDSLEANHLAKIGITLEKALKKRSDNYILGIIKNKGKVNGATNENLKNQSRQSEGKKRVFQIPYIKLYGVQYVLDKSTDYTPNSHKPPQHVYHDYAHARVVCDDRGAECQGLFQWYRGSHFILLSTVTMVQRGRGVLYIKADNAANLTFVTADRACVVPVSARSLPPSLSVANSSGCTLPRLDPFDPSVTAFFQRRQPLQCEGVAFTSYHGNTLKVVRKDDRGAPLRRITYREIHRENATDNGYTLGFSHELPLNLTNGIRLTHDFIQVTAEFTNGATQVDYHCHVTPKPEVSNINRGFRGIPLNIIILGLDRNSAGTFQRLLPDAYEVLKKELNAHMFEGFSLLGEGTTPQLTGLLTGKTVESNCAKHEARRGVDGAQTVDEWPFIFKTLKDKGYVTMFSEDAPSIGAFAMRLKGFANQPTDHYGRTFWSAVPFKETTGLHDNCINSQPQHRLQLEYLKSLFYSYPRQPKFGFTFLGSLCHQESINTISYANEDVRDLFYWLKREGHLNDTMLVVMGDHGARFGEIRATVQGRLEERLPFLSIVLPEWFKGEFSQLFSALELNQKRLITPLDLHATFMHILNFPHDPSRSQLSDGVSLFTCISESRDCQGAGIPEHFCPCLEWEPIRKHHAHIVMGAQAAAYKINSFLALDKTASKLCHFTRLKNIKSAVQEILFAKVLTFKETENGIGLGIGRPLYDKAGSPSECRYIIQFSTQPGSARFEVMVVIQDNKASIRGSISRINKYGSQPSCIAQALPHLRPFCVCK